MASEARESERVVGRYVMRDEIASGGMATVHIGRLLGPVGFARTVAIKRLHAHLAKDPEFVTMLLDEARLAARIRHPNVVSTLDIVVDKGELWIVMDYVEGESLSRLASATSRTGGRVPLGIVASVISGALYGLHAAHEATSETGAPLSVIHRDVSPQNIMVGVDGVARVLDFGVARAAGRLQTTREGTLKGKLAYMSPEQVRGDPLDRRSDVYAMSVVLWEMVVGKRLFVAEHDVELLQKVLSEKPARPSSVVPGLPAALDDVVMRGLRHDRSDRFSTAAEMAEALQRVSFATPGEIGGWVHAVGGAAIAERTQRIARLESQSSGAPPAVDPALPAEPAPSVRPKLASATVVGQVARELVPPVSAAPTVPDPSRLDPSELSLPSVTRPAPRVVPLGVGLAVLGGVILAGAVVIGALLARTPPVESTQAPLAETAVASPRAPSATATAAPPAPPSASTSPPTPAVRAERPLTPRRPALPRPAAKCNPPYTVDPDGIRSPKPECL